MLNSSYDHFGLHQGKKCQSDHEVQGPPKTCFKAYIITNMVQRVCGGRGKRCALGEKARAHGIEMFL